MSVDFAGIIDGLKVVGGMVAKVFDFLGKGRLDETAVAKMFYDLQGKIKDVEAEAWKLQVELTKSMMAAAPWRTPLVLASGGGLIAVCVWNLVARSVGWAQHGMDVRSPEIAVLAGMFVFTASGAVDLLIRAFEWIRKGSEKKPQNEEAQ